jgi:uncharacterized membrane protein YbhN (UPF0104 family)
MQLKVLRNLLAICIVLVTIFCFAYYLDTHPSILGQLKKTPPNLIAILLVLYFCTVIAVGFTLLATLRLCDLQLKFKEVIMITVYSTVINFFGPLQSGPVFRAVYLKRKHNLKLKNYSLATLIYYAFYAGFSGIFLLSGILRWWLFIIVLLGIAAVYVFRNSQLKIVVRIKELHLKSLGLLGLATLIQVTLLAIIYYIEVHSVDPRVRLDQAIIYTGAANFSLFVALTPGAIGFREAFLVFSRRLHHIGLATIVAANVVDRCVYILMLTILVIFIFASHLNDKVKLKTDTQEADELHS